MYSGSQLLHKLFDPIPTTEAISTETQTVEGKLANEMPVVEKKTKKSKKSNRDVRIDILERSGQQLIS
jgi:hypothetical protein